jgi:hypothetical protein
MKTEEKKKVTLELTSSDIKAMARYAGLRSNNSPKLILRAFISSVLINDETNQSLHKVKFNSADYER